MFLFLQTSYKNIMQRNTSRNLKKAIKDEYGLWLLVAAFLLFIMISFFFYYKDYYVSMLGVRESIVRLDTEGEYLALTKDHSLQRKVYLSESKIEGLSLRFFHENMDENVIIEVSIIDPMQKEMIHFQITAKDITDTGYYEKIFDAPLNLDSDGEYTIRLQLLDGKAVSLLSADKEYISLGLLGGLTNVVIYILVFFGVAIIILIGVALVTYCRKMSIEKAFALIALVSGIIVMVLIPPYNTPDEAYHFSTSYSYSSKLIGQSVTNSDGMVVMRKSDYDYYMKWSNKGGTTITRDTYIMEFTSFNEAVNEEIRDSYFYRAAGRTTCLAYVPQVFGITIARVLHLNAIQLFMAGRLMSLLAYIAIMYAAFRVLPFGKMALFVIGLFPMTLELAASYNYDAIILPCCFLAVSYILHLTYQADKIRKKDIVVMCGLVLIIALVKYIYLILFMLGLIIPKEKFGSGKNKIYMAMLLVAVGLGTIIFLNTTTLSTLGTSSSGGQALTWTDEEKYTFRYACQNPLHTLGILFRTFEFSTSDLAGGAIGTLMGWMNIGVSFIPAMGFLVAAMIGTLKTYSEKKYVTPVHRGCAIACAGLLTIVIYFSLLVSWTRKLAPTIDGLQGRYFLPVFVVLFIIVFRNNLITVKKEVCHYLMLGTVYLEAISIMELLRTVLNG